MNNIHFTHREYADMHFIYSFCSGNATAARRMYAERYPERQKPSVPTFIQVHTRLCETGSAVPRYAGSGRISAQNLELDGQILRAVERNPRASVRRIANQLGVTRMLVWRVLKENFLHPYHFQKVQSLQPEDYPMRREFCQLMLDFHQRDIDFVRTILFTDEATFTRDGILNLHNMHEWSYENPHSIIESHHQQTFSVNVWGGIVGDHLLGPFFLPRRLGAIEYLNFLQHVLFELMEDVPIALRQRLWYLHDGAPAHFSQLVRRHLNLAFPGRWIGRGNDAPISWPSRSPDLNAADFYLWGHAKSLVYRISVNTQEQLRHQIIEAFNTIRNNHDVFTRIRFNFIRRLRACIEADGGLFEHLL